MTLCLFNQKQFYELLVSSQNITDKLNNLRISCLKNDVYFHIYTANMFTRQLMSFMMSYSQHIKFPSLNTTLYKQYYTYFKPHQLLQSNS